MCGMFDGLYDDWYDEIDYGYRDLIVAKPSTESTKKTKKAKSTESVVPPIKMAHVQELEITK